MSPLRWMVLSAFIYAIDQNYSFIYGLITYAKIYLKMSTDIHE